MHEDPFALPSKFYEPIPCITVQLIGVVLDAGAAEGRQVVENEHVGIPSLASIILLAITLGVRQVGDAELLIGV